MRTLTENTGLYTDFYELTMAQAYFYSGKQNETSTFDYFFRTNPYKGGYIVFAGLQDLLGILTKFSYNDENLAFLKQTGLRDEFLAYLKDFRFKGKIFSILFLLNHSTT